jgi:hypothetical protein
VTTAVALDRPEAAAARLRAEVLVLGLLVTLGLTVAVYYVLGVYQGRPYPYNTALFQPADPVVAGEPRFLGHYFGDFWLTLLHSRSPSPYLDTSAPVKSTYLPLAQLVLRPLAALPFVVALVAYLCATVGLSAGAVFTALRDLALIQRLQVTLLLGLLSYPVIFLLDRGNFESIVIALVALAVWQLRRRPWVAALAIAAAAAMKMFPILLLVLLVAERRFRPALGGAVLTVLLVVLPAAAWHGGAVANLRGYLVALKAFTLAELGPSSLQHASDLPGTVVLLLDDRLSQAETRAIVTLVSVTVVLLTALWVLWRRPSHSAGVSVVILAMVVAPHPAFDYRLAYLLIPIVIFLREGTWGGRRDLALGGAWAVAVAPLSLPILHHDVGVGVLVRPLVLLLLGLVIVVSEGPRSRRQVITMGGVP